jgi:hypothetical protein
MYKGTNMPRGAQLLDSSEEGSALLLHLVDFHELNSEFLFYLNVMKNLWTPPIYALINMASVTLPSTD